MESRKERIQKAVRKALKKPIETKNDPGNVFDEVDKTLKMIEQEELPHRIIGKVPKYINIIKEFSDAFGVKDEESLIQFVLSNKALVYDDKDFIFYLAFIIKRFQKLGQKEQADAMSFLMESVIKIGLLYG
jgi:hypothetical protein